MRSVVVLLLILIFLGTGAYALDQRGLLTRETLVLLSKPRPKAQMMDASLEPVGLAASIQKKQRELDKETERMEELATRLESQRKEIDAERATLDEKLKMLEQTRAEANLKSKQASPLSALKTLPPEQIASALRSLPDSTVAQILLQLRRGGASNNSVKLDSESSSLSNEDLTKLVKIYEGMSPEQAASILENLPDPAVARILLQMRGRKATQIMGEMSTNKSVAVSQLLIPERVNVTN